MATVSEENIMSYKSLYELQKDPNNLEYALDCALSTVMYSEDNFSSQVSAERLLKRIYTKLELSKKFGEDEVFNAIISESTDHLLNALKTIHEETDKYVEVYPLMDFVYQDFSTLINQFHFERFKEYFQLNKLLNFKLIEAINGDQLKKLTKHIIEIIIENNYYLNNDTYSGIVKLGKEKLLNYLNIQINPYLDKIQVDTYDQQFLLLKSYKTLYESYYGDSFSENMPKEKYDYFIELEDYYDYLSNVEILSRRLLTVEETTLSRLLPVFIDYVEKYQTITLKTERLNNAILKMIKNAATRLSYVKLDLSLNNYNFSELSISNEEINESLKKLFSSMSTKPHKEEPEKQNKLITLLKNPFIYIPTLSIIGIFIFIIVVLPLTVKGTLYKNIGLYSKALSLLEKAAIKQPMNPDIHIKTAQIYEKLGREEDAMNEYKIASKVMDMKED
ncbi:MAG: tetratricopeptide repeat protein [bacterium]